MSQPSHFPIFERTDGRAENLHPFKALIARLSQAFGPAGSEEQVRALIREEIRPLADEVRVDGMGNLIARKRGSGSSPRSKVMLAAHMDEVGLIATQIDAKGFIRFGSLGQTQNLSLLGQRCMFANGTIGVIGREEKKAKPREIEYDRLFIDVGAPAGSAVPVKVGDAAALYGNFVDGGARLIGKALDDRVGCAILIETLRQLKKPIGDVWFVFTVQAQVGARGATTSTFGLEPDLAIAVDVTEAGDTPEAVTNEVALGKGPAIKIKDPGILVSPPVRNLIVDAAREARVAYQFEVGVQGGTDTSAMQVSREGTHAGAISIPLRYPRTASEMVDWDDVQNSVKLLLALLARPVTIQSA